MALFGTGQAVWDRVTEAPGGPREHPQEALNTTSVSPKRTKR
jgi:hypothetical protein